MAFQSQFDDEQVISDINMTPLVDVMLVLLIIFMLTMPVITHSIALELPKVSADPTVKHLPQTVVLSLNANGAIYWDAQRLSVTELSNKLQQAAQQQPQPQFQLQGDRQVAYHHVAQLLALVQQAGVQQLSFITEPTTN